MHCIGLGDGDRGVSRGPINCSVDERPGYQVQACKQCENRIKVDRRLPDGSWGRGSTSDTLDGLSS